MSAIRILATEDDALHEEMLRITIQKLGYILIDVVYDPSVVLRKTAATKPDLLLMDIDLGSGVSGIDLMKDINSQFDIPVIYVTSFSDSDTFEKAKKTCPCAYVVKPYREEELQRAIELAIYNKHQKDLPFAGWENDIITDDYIYIKENESLEKVYLKDIHLIAAYDKYCKIFTSSRKILIRSRLSDIVRKLPSTKFCRVHRSYIVNMEAVEQIHSGSHKIYVSGKEISISKTYKDNFFARLHAIG